MARCATCGVGVSFLDNLCGDCAESQSTGNTDAAIHHAAPAVGFQAFQLETPNGIRATSVKNGFSWPAFFFGAIWAWIKGMIGVGFGLFFLNIVLNIVAGAIGATLGGPGVILVIIMSLGVATWVGSSGNEWVRNSLLRKGYKPVESDPISTHSAAEKE